MAGTPLRWDMILPNGEPLRFNTPGAKWNGTVEEVMAAIAQQQNNMANDINAAELSDADIQAITDAFATINSKLPFAVALTNKDKKGIFKAGPKSLSFVESARDAAGNNPTILAGNFDATGFQRHVKLFQQASNFEGQANELAEKLKAIKIAIGGIAMGEGRDVYTYAKAALKKTPGLQPVVDQLADRFKHASSDSGTPTPPTP